MNRDLDVVVVCEINVDIVVTGMDGLPRFGAEHTVDDVVLTAGSSGVLTATGLAALGLRAGICGMVGEDAFGRFMLEHCARHGIAHDGVVVRAGERTGASVLLSTGDDRAILTHLGAMATFDFGALRFDIVQNARHLHLSSYFLQSALRPRVPELLDRAHALGLTTSADTGHDPAEEWEIDTLLPGLDIFLPNEVEAMAVTGTHSAHSALAALRGCVPTVAIKCGRNGAWAARGADEVFVPGFSARVLDTTGAGDAFNAGFLDGWLAGSDLNACLRQGNACGAMTVAHVGGSGGFVAADIAQLLEQKA